MDTTALTIISKLKTAVVCLLAWKCGIGSDLQPKAYWYDRIIKIELKSAQRYVQCCWKASLTLGAKDLKSNGQLQLLNAPMGVGWWDMNSTIKRTLEQ